MHPRLGSLFSGLIVLAVLAASTRASAATVRFDFETGDLQGWRIMEGRLESPVCSRETYHNPAWGLAYNKQGKYFVSTLETASGTMDPAQTAVLESPVFVLEGAEGSFLTGGGSEKDA